MNENIKLALDVFQKQAEQFLSLNLLVLGGLVAQYFSLLEKRRSKSWTIWKLSALALGPPAALLSYNAYRCGELLQSLLIDARRGAQGEGALLAVLSHAPFGWQLIVVGVSVTWSLVAVSAVIVRTEPNKHAE